MNVLCDYVKLFPVSNFGALGLLCCSGDTVAATVRLAMNKSVELPGLKNLILSLDRQLSSYLQDPAANTNFTAPAQLVYRDNLGRELDSELVRPNKTYNYMIHRLGKMGL